MTFYVVPIVEGQTEAGCIERLLQRVWKELLGARLRLQVLLPSRGKRDALIDPENPFIPSISGSGGAQLHSFIQASKFSRTKPLKTPNSQLCVSEEVSTVFDRTVSPKPRLDKQFPVRQRDQFCLGFAIPS